MRKDEKQRLEREEMEARGFLPKLERLLLAVDDSANGKFAARIAGLVAGTQAMPTTVIQIKADKARGKAAALAEQEKADIAGERVKVFAEKVGRAQAPEEKSSARSDVTTIVETSAKPKLVAVEAEKGYDLLIVGLEKSVARRNEFHNDVTKLVADFEGPLAIVDARDLHREKPLRGALSILVPVNGTEMSRHAAEVAIAIACASKAPLTTLYVAPRSAGGKKRSRRYEEAILKDIAALAETYSTELRTAVRTDVAPEDAIVKELARGKHNLVVMGVGRRPGEKLFFGDTAAALLAKSDRSLLLLAS